MAPQPKFDGHTKDIYIGRYFEEVDPPDGKYLTNKQLYRMSIEEVAKLTNREDDESESDASMDYDTDEERADKERRERMMKEYKKYCHLQYKERELKRLRRQLDIGCPPGGFDTGHAVWQDYMSYWRRQ